MGMEIRDEAMEAAAANNSSSGSSANSECSHPVVKGKRTKRQRVHQYYYYSAAAASSASSSSGVLSETTGEEDEDMANCLILLAQGRRTHEPGGGPKSDGGGGGGDGGGVRLSGRRLAEGAVAATNGKAAPGFYAYECKTCNKCFPSFQALGGHRSSHKKPKNAAAAAAVLIEEKKQATEEDNSQVSVNVSNIIPTILSGDYTAAVSAAAATAALTTATNHNSNIINKPRVHECSICGSEFSSGQALGGHMRRHRPTSAAVMETQGGAKKEKSVLSLDLNLPAPTDDGGAGDYPKSPSFPFAAGQPLLFSPSALVDCHY